MNSNLEKVGVVYHRDYLIHTHSQHPERKERLEAIWKVLEQESFKDLVELIEPESAGVEDITLVHHENHVEAVKEACREDRGFLDMDTYIVPESYQVALLSAGGALKGLQQIMKGNIKKVFSLGRPPGHHAEKSRSMGFCLFNNIAIAAETARKKYGLNRIAIVDWDVHHGNGTQNSLYEEDEILFISIHQNPAYPGTGHLDEIGSSRGKGYNINIPLSPGTGNGDFVKVFSEVVLPVLEEYRPQLVMISAGQDSHARDPLAGMNLTDGGYYYMASSLKEVADKYADGRMLLTLEGGYHLEAQASAVGQVIKALSQKDSVAEGMDYSISGNMTLNNLEILKNYLGDYWKALQQ